MSNKLQFDGFPGPKVNLNQENAGQTQNPARVKVDLLVDEPLSGNDSIVNAERGAKLEAYKDEVAESTPELMNEPDLPDLFEEVREFLSMPPEAVTEETLEWGIGLVVNMYLGHIEAETKLTANIVHLAISMGMVNRQLKCFVEKLNNEWSEWTEENLPFLEDRELECWMELAAHPCSYAYAEIGKVRLLELVRATERIPGEDTIGQFLEENEIVFNRHVEELRDLLDFNAQLNLAISFRKITDAGIIVEKESVKAYLEQGHKVDEKCLKTLKQINKQNRDPNVYLLNPGGFTTGIPADTSIVFH